ncbi:HAD family hydrolase [Stratiformator vulcanicus]|uniref:Phosphoglycolate phosphatase n=1 Tax=Stratiformator vulcanicus TaxID=2527980 RepID=A0A517QXM9_9PLAN|nr:HAD family hydrolase [Stratiformator vulcanicus]QDT36330.1 Phosphoglycolate phosphatase [Stratiformator vulcanicus]
MIATPESVIRRLSSKLEPNSTNARPDLTPIAGIKAVMFDVYGTLFISGSGDVGTAAAGAKGKAFTDAAEACGIKFDADADTVVERMIAEIKTFQEERRTSGTEYPEVEIRDVWGRTLEAAGIEVPAPDAIEQLAIEYESRVNPVWPMPHCRESLEALRDAGLKLGIVSNAQFFTPALFPALLDQTRAELGFDPRLEYFSYEHLQAKPGRFLYEAAAAALVELGITPAETLYVGNDMLNDVTPAAAVGFRTALFAGDARSLRMREDDARVTGVTADVTVTDLAQISGIVTDRTG